MRYKRQSDEACRCDECSRLAAESSTLYLRYLDAKDAMQLTDKRDRDYAGRRQHLKEVIGQMREARRRADLHEQTHQDEYSN